jgi:hypothetical protein
MLGTIFDLKQTQMTCLLCFFFLKKKLDNLGLNTGVFSHFVLFLWVFLFSN